MRALHLYVLVYVVLVVGAALTMSRTGLLERVGTLTTMLGMVGALTLAGLLLALGKR